jgi:hypothetical protein
MIIVINLMIEHVIFLMIYHPSNKFNDSIYIKLKQELLHYLFLIYQITNGCLQKIQNVIFLINSKFLIPKYHLNKFLN